MRIAVIGTGYVGLVTGTCFAETGNKVVCVDIDKVKVKKLSAGQITIYEPGLEKIFLRNLKEERLRFTTDLASVVEEAEVIFLALPTPPGADGAA
ncbi:MAG: 3-hydroxyacyl-CoA dehydrogenase NAD-binding domain-containing protein, partial [Sphingomonadales bacterium]